MFVHRSMTSKVITIGKDAGIHEVRQLMTQHKIRHVPVVDENDRLIGIVTDRDIRSALPLEMLKFPERCQELCQQLESITQIKVADIMTADPVTQSAPMIPSRTPF